MSKAKTPYWPQEELDGAPRTRDCISGHTKTIGQLCGDLERLCVTLEREGTRPLEREANALEVGRSRDIVERVMESHPYTDYTYVATNSAVERDRANRYARTVGLRILSQLSANSSATMAKGDPAAVTPAKLPRGK